MTEDTHLPPNFFDYATNELSQDAFICWLIKWSENTNDTKLRDLGRRFVNALMSKCGGPEIKKISKAEVTMQDNRIDVLARINNEYVLLIEDKTYSDKKSGNQLQDYWNAVIDGKTEFKETSEEKLFAIFLKTGNQSLHSKLEIEREYKYKFFGRDDFLEVLKSYKDDKGDNTIVLDFLQHWTKINEESDNWEKSKFGDRDSYAWEGLFMKLDEKLYDKCEWWDWGYVPSLSGGFLGIWWLPKGIPEDYSDYLKLQVENEKLCFKLTLNDWPNEKKWEWYERITSQSEFAVKPKRMGSGKVVTVAVYKDGWLRFDDRGVLDLDKTVGVLRSAEEILRQVTNN